MVEQLQSNAAGVTAENGEINSSSPFLGSQRQRRARPNVSVLGDLRDVIVQLALRRFHHRCHRIRAASSGTATPAQLRYHSRRVVARWTCRGHRRVIDAAAGCARQRSRALHFLPYGIAAVDSVGIKLDSHRIRVEIIEKDLDLKDVLVRVGLDLHVAEAQRGPFLFQSMLPIDHLPARLRLYSAARSR